MIAFPLILKPPQEDASLGASAADIKQGGDA